MGEVVMAPAMRKLATPRSRTLYYSTVAFSIANIELGLIM